MMTTDEALAVTEAAIRLGFSRRSLIAAAALSVVFGVASWLTGSGWQAGVIPAGGLLVGLFNLFVFRQILLTQRWVRRKLGSRDRSKNG